MSARQPFIPQKKQASASATASAADSSSDSLKADLSMSSDGGDTTRSSATSISLHSNASEDIPPLGGINKPLNLANLGKKNHTGTRENSPFLPKPRRSFEEDASHPFSPSAKPFKPTLAQRGMKIAAPSPFFPSSASFQPMSAFRAPRVPSPTKRHSAASIDDLNVNNTHTSTEESLVGPDDSISQFNVASAEAPRRLVRSSTRGLDDLSAQDLNSVNEDRTRNDMSGDAESLAYEDAHHAFEDRYTKMPARRVQKRVERAEEADAEVEYSTKRYRLDDSEELQTNFSGRRESLAPYHSSPHRSPSLVPPPRTSSVYAPTGEQAFAPATSVHKEHALSQLFGQDLDTFVRDHLDIYEEAKNKWADCSIEEWTAGADELAGKFSKLLDFVKDHMNSKLALYANLNSTLGSHRKVLAEREKTLEDVRTTLIRNGGVVCGVGARPCASNVSETSMEMVNADDKD